MNCIIKRIKNFYKTAAYIDINNQKNTDIDQSISNNNYKQSFKIKNMINTIANNYIINNKRYYQYEIIDNIGLMGISFTNSKKEKIVIEFQLGRLTATSINKAAYQFYNQIEHLPFKEQQEKQKIFDKQIYNHYFCGIISPYVNGENNIIDNKIYWFEQNNSIAQLRQKSKQLIDDIKENYQ